MFDEMAVANARYAREFALAGTAPRAAKHFALVTCMDTRIEPLAVLGLRPGDAKILRNAGGRVTPDVLRGLALATGLLEVTEIAVMQHTGCALAGRNDEDLAAALPTADAVRAAGCELLAMPDPDAALRADVDAVRACPLLAPGVRVEGWRYDVETGRVMRIIVDEGAGSGSTGAPA